MGVAAYNRGSRGISAQVDALMSVANVLAGIAFPAERTSQRRGLGCQVPAAGSEMEVAHVKATTGEPSRAGGAGASAPMSPVLPAGGVQ